MKIAILLITALFLIAALRKNKSICLCFPHRERDYLEEYSKLWR